MKIEMQNVKLDKVFQTEVDDSDNEKLCMWLVDVYMAWGHLKRETPNLAPLTLAEINKIQDASIKNGGLLDRDKDGNSDDGYVANHEKVAAAAGLTGFTKVREPYDKHKVINLLQWQCLVEIRSSGHSMLAHGWFMENKKPFAHVLDPWPKTDDVRLDLDRGMTLRQGKAGFVDSRKIVSFAWYRKNGTDWI